MATIVLSPSVREAIAEGDVLSAFHIGPRAMLVTDPRQRRGYVTVRFDALDIPACECGRANCEHAREAARQRDERRERALPDMGRSLRNGRWAHFLDDDTADWPDLPE